MTLMPFHRLAGRWPALMLAGLLASSPVFPTPLSRETAPPAALPRELDPILTRHLARILAYVHRQINPDTGLAESLPGDGRLRHWSVVYDNAMRAMLHIQTGHVDLAEDVIDYFIRNKAIRKMGWIPKDGAMTPVDGWIVNIVDAAEGRPGGRGVEHIAHVGPNAYLGIASIHLYRATGKFRYLEFARERWQLIKTLQCEDVKDPNFGGVRMGPMGDPGNPREQRLGFTVDGPSFYQFFNGEHAADFKAFSDLMVQVDPSRRSDYDRASKLISVWDRRIYDRSTGLFFIGTCEVGYYDDNVGRMMKPGVIPIHPLDTSALKLSAYGVKGLEPFERGAAERIRAAIDRHFRVTISYMRSGQRMLISGYDFVTARDRATLLLYIEEGPQGDVKVKKGVGRRPLLTDEWSNWVALADLRLADDYERSGDFVRAARRRAAYRQNALVDGLRSATPLFGAKGVEYAYPYAHPLPYALNKPVGFGWNTHHEPYSVIGGVARGLGILRFDPFRLDGGEHAIRIRMPRVRIGGGNGRDAAPGQLYTEAEVYVKEAWRYVNEAQKGGAISEKWWRMAAQTIERMMAEHPDWMTIAEQQNRIAGAKDEKYPLMGRDDLTVRDIEPVYRDYWALYHVGTAEFIRVMAYSHLSDLARENGDAATMADADRRRKEAADAIASRYAYAQAYDQNGWMWQPIQSLREYLSN